MSKEDRRLKQLEREAQDRTVHWTLATSGACGKVDGAAASGTHHGSRGQSRGCDGGPEVWTYSKSRRSVRS